MVIQFSIRHSRKTTEEIELLFQMLRGFSSHLLPQYQFFKDFLQETVAQSYPVDWKRNAFFKFAELFHDTKYTQEMKAKVCGRFDANSKSHSLH